MTIQQNISLKPYNSFDIDEQASFFVEINKEEELIELFSDKKWRDISYLVVGGGSNILFTKSFDGLIIKMNIKGISILENTNDEVLLEVGGGEVWNDFVNYCVNHNFAGVENLSLIPGTVGAAPVQNIGAYGVELKDVFYSCKAFEIKTGELKTFFIEDCDFGYRESFFKKHKGEYVICSVQFKLKMQHQLNISYGAISSELEKRNITKPTIKDISEVVSFIRVSKLPDPSTIGNAGSFFKNPVIPKIQFDLLREQYSEIVYFLLITGEVKIAAGWLIEQCGWKGRVIGNTGTWKNQALVLVNHGNASGSEIFALSSKIIESVKNKFGIVLEREVNIF